MSPITLAEPPQCWSYAMTGERCSKPAGHDDEHEVVRYTHWTDEEAWTPQRILDRMTAIRPNLGTVTLTNTERPVVAVDYDDEDILDEDDGPGVERLEPCFNCRHAVHDGTCTVGESPTSVGCGCNFRSA